LTAGHREADVIDVRGATVLAALSLALIAPVLAAPLQPRPMSELKPVITLPTGNASSWVEVAPGAVWVASLQPNVLHRIDPQTNQIVATVPLPGNPCSGLAAGLGSLWVPLCGPAPRLAKIDLATNRIVAVFMIGPAAGEGGVAVSPDSVWLVTDRNGTLARINPRDGSVRQTVHLPANSYNPLYRDGDLWVTEAQGAAVTVIDARSGKVLGTVQTGAHPRFLTAGEDSIWTLNAGDGTVSRIDARHRKLTQTVALGVAARGGDIKYADGLVWITLLKTPLSAIDARSGKLLCQWSGAGGDSMALGSGSIWLSNVRQQTLTRFDVRDALAHCRGR
jgi:streptogramin lyase